MTLTKELHLGIAEMKLGIFGSLFGLCVAVTRSIRIKPTNSVEMLRDSAGNQNEKPVECL